MVVRASRARPFDAAIAGISGKEAGIFKSLSVRRALIFRATGARAIADGFDIRFPTDPGGRPGRSPMQKTLVGVIPLLLLWATASPGQGPEKTRSPAAVLLPAVAPATPEGPAGLRVLPPADPAGPRAPVPSVPLSDGAKKDVPPPPPLAKAPDGEPACPGGCPQEGGCGRHWWVTADYLVWWVKGAPLPPVATTGPFDPNTFVPGVTPSPGAIGSPGTVVLRGGHDIDLGTFSGVQLRAGYWLTGEAIAGVELGGLLLERRTATFRANSDVNGNPLLKTPFFDTFTQQEIGANASFGIDAANAFGGLFGGIVVQNGLRLWGTDVVAVARTYADTGMHIDLQAGVRYLDLGESATVVQSFRPFGQPLFGGFLGRDVPTNGAANSIDAFRTRNQFYGATVGGRLDYQLPCSFGLTVLGRLGVGITEERSAVNGSSTFFQPGGPAVTVPGGVLALPSNIGVQRGSAFAVLPELNLSVYYQVTSCLRATVGYSFLYWSDVVRPGDQIDHNVDQRQIPTGQNFTPGFVGTAPAPRFQHTDFWAQGVNFGLELTF
jgi:hypothetical protein